MKDSNDFNKEDLERWFGDCYRCFWCEISKEDKRKWNCGNVSHHILGRRGEFKSSLLNCGLVNNELCHLPHHPLLMKRENKIKLLKKTLEYLMNKGYVLTKLDEDFIEKNINFYKQILQQKKE